MPDRNEVKRKSAWSFGSAEGVIALGFIVAGLFWVSETLLDTLVFHEESPAGSVLPRLVWPGAHELWMRALFLVFFIAFIMYVYRLLASRRRTDEALRASESRYRTLFETMAQGVVYLDADGKIFSANPAAERILGLSFDEMNGRDPHDPRWAPIHEDGSEFPGSAHPALVALTSGQTLHDVPMGVFNPKEGAYRWIRISAVPQIRAGETKPYQVYTLFEDVTERERAEAALLGYQTQLEALVAERTAALRTLLTQSEQTHSQLVQSEKMAALGRLAASMSHEINNPLQSVKGCLELTQEELQGERRGDKIERCLEIAMAEIDRIASIVASTRDFYRPARQGLQSTDVHVVLEDVLRLTHNQLEKGRVTVERQWAASLPSIEANPAHLKQIFLNLVLNAIDAMPESGRLGMCTEMDEIPGRGERPARPAVRIEISDSGVGMSTEALSRLFEPYYTTKDHGSGLGLSISYGLIMAHHGQVTVSSQMGQGTTFTLLFPVTQPQEPISG